MIGRVTQAAALFAPLLLLGVLAAPSSAQAGELVIHHSFPVAGSELSLVVEGLQPNGLALVTIGSGPPSLQRAVWAQAEEIVSALDPLEAFLKVDSFGRLAVSAELESAADVGAELDMLVQDVATGAVSEILRLRVVTPTVVVSSASSFERIDLTSGSVLTPALSRAGGLDGLAVSPDGRQAYVLREQGLLEVISTAAWNATLATHRLDPASDTLAASPAAGVAFALARPGGQPFTPSGRLLFLDDDGPVGEPLLLEPMGQTVAGERSVVTPDGLTAFVAEDDLLVREIDLLGRRSPNVFTAGRGGDLAIADMALEGSRLLVTTRSLDGRAGTLTVLDLLSGRLDVQPLDIDPGRIVVLDDDLALVLPSASSAFHVVEAGLVTRRVEGAGVWLDAAAHAGAAVLLRRDDAGMVNLDRFDPLAGLSTFVEGLPPADRVVTGGFSLAVLLGDPTGQVWLVNLDSGDTRRIMDVLADPTAPFDLLPQ